LRKLSRPQNRMTPSMATGPGPMPMPPWGGAPYLHMIGRGGAEQLVSWLLLGGLLRRSC